MKNINHILSQACLLAVLFLAISCDDETTDTANLVDREKEIIEGHLAENGITDYEVTPNGVYYYTLKQGIGVQPPEGSLTLLGYEGRLPYGNIFDSSFLRDDTIKVQRGTGLISSSTFTQNCDTVDFDLGTVVCDTCPELNGSVIIGWVDAIENLIGDRKRFYIPSYLGYGVQGSGPIPGNSVLLFDIELYEFEEITEACQQ